VNYVWAGMGFTLAIFPSMINYFLRETCTAMFTRWCNLLLFNGLAGFVFYHVHATALKHNGCADSMLTSKQNGRGDPVREQTARRRDSVLTLLVNAYTIRTNERELYNGGSCQGNRRRQVHATALALRW
jgi:hypothetical protein